MVKEERDRFIIFPFSIIDIIIANDIYNDITPVMFVFNWFHKVINIDMDIIMSTYTRPGAVVSPFPVFQSGWVGE